MFFDRLQAACKLRNTAPTTAVRAVACSSGMVDGWKKGSFPRSDVVVRLADFLDVSADYLLERTDDPSPVTQDMRKLDDSEIRLIDGLRASDNHTRDIVYNMVAAALAPGVESDPQPVVFLPPIGGISRQGKRCFTPHTGLKRIDGNAAAGPPITAAPETDRAARVPDKYLNPRYFLVRARGDSMVGASIDDGDLCVFDRDAYRDEGAIMLVQVDGLTD